MNVKHVATLLNKHRCVGVIYIFIIELGRTEYIHFISHFTQSCSPMNELKHKPPPHKLYYAQASTLTAQVFNFPHTSLHVSLQMIKAPVVSDWSNIMNRKRFENVISVTWQKFTSVWNSLYKAKSFHLQAMWHLITHFTLYIFRVINTYKSKIYFQLVALVHIYKTATPTRADRGSALVKVLCYKSEGRWFDPSWSHWNFSLT